MLKVRRLFSGILMMMIIAVPAMAQMRTTRTIVNSVQEPTATTIRTTTPRAGGGQDVQNADVPAGEPGVTEMVTADGTRIQVTKAREATTTVTQADDVTITTRETPTATVTEATSADPCAEVPDKSVLYKKFHPTKKSSKLAECFWQQKGFEMLNSTQLVSSGGSVAAAMDTASDFLFGWRFMFSMAVASKADEDEPAATALAAGDDTPGETKAKQESALTLFQANGGNVAVSAAYPLYARLWGDPEFDGKNNDNGTTGFSAVTYVRLAGTFDAFGDTGGSPTTLDWKKFNGNAEWAVTSEANLVTVKDIFNLDLFTKAAYVAGTKTFRTALGADEKEAGPLLHGELGLTFRMKSLVVAATYNYYSADGIDNGTSVTVGFVR